MQDRPVYQPGSETPHRWQGRDPLPAPGRVYPLDVLTTAYAQTRPYEAVS